MAMDGTHRLVFDEQGGGSLDVLLEHVPAKGVHMADIWTVLRLCESFPVNILRGIETYMWYVKIVKCRSISISRI